MSERKKSINDELKEIAAGFTNRTGMELKGNAKETYKLLGTAATIFCHPHSDFGLFLMGVRVGVALGYATGLPKRKISNVFAMPGLMTLLAWLHEDKRYFEMHCPDSHATKLIKATERAEKMLELFYSQKETKDEEEKGD